MSADPPAVKLPAVWMRVHAKVPSTANLSTLVVLADVFAGRDGHTHRIVAAHFQNGTPVYCLLCTYHAVNDVGMWLRRQPPLYASPLTCLNCLALDNPTATTNP